MICWAATHVCACVSRACWSLLRCLPRCTGTLDPLLSAFALDAVRMVDAKGEEHIVVGKDYKWPKKVRARGGAPEQC